MLMRITCLTGSSEVNQYYPYPYIIRNCIIQQQYPPTRIPDQ